MDNSILIHGLVHRDEQITRAVFYSTEPGVSCRALLCKKLVDFNYIPPEEFYDMLVSDLYAIFMNLNKAGKEMGDARNLLSIKNPDAFFGWIEMTVVRHLSALRKKGKKFGDLLLENGEVNPHIAKDSLLEETTREDYRRDFERLLRLMSNRAHAQILRMSILEDLSIKETARALGITEGAVNMRKKRAMQELTELLAKDKAKYHGKS
jgi:RNA polymerase sigma factor (sigma-70 family)